MTIQSFKEGVLKTWNAFKFYMKDPLFAVPICFILAVAIFLTIREITYKEPVVEVPTVETVDQVITMDSVQSANLDLTQILKDCPSGTKFYTVAFGDVTFNRLIDDQIEVITENETVVNYSNKGYNILVNDSTCTIFPSKMNHNWYDFDKTW